MVKKVIILSISAVMTLSLVSCDPSKSYHNAIDKVEEINDKAQENDVTGKFLRKSLEKNEKVNELMQGESETSTASNTAKSKDNKTNFLGR